MTDKTTEALKLAEAFATLELVLNDGAEHGNWPLNKNCEDGLKCLAVIREALAEQEKRAIVDSGSEVSSETEAQEPVACCQQKDTKEYEEMVKRQRQYLTQDGSRKDGVADYAAPVSAEASRAADSLEEAAKLFTYDQVKAHIQAAVLSEREACAKVCETTSDNHTWSDYLDGCANCAAAIRARK